MINTYEIVGDEALEDALLEKTLTELVDDRIKTVGTNAFTLIPDLKKVELPNVTKIEESSFLGCSKLVDVSFPNLEHMSNNALRECTSLQCLDLPKLTYFGGWGLYGSTAFKTLILRNENVVCTIANGAAFNGTLIASGTGYIYVPRALLDSYKSATHWSTHASQFRALEDYTMDGTITGEFNLNYIGDAPIEAGLVEWFNPADETAWDDTYLLSSKLNTGKTATGASNSGTWLYSNRLTKPTVFNDGLAQIGLIMPAMSEYGIAGECTVEFTFDVPSNGQIFHLCTAPLNIGGNNTAVYSTHNGIGGYKTAVCHAMFVFTADGLLRYVNGQYVDTVTAVAEEDIASSIAFVRPNDGGLGEVRLYNRALTENEVKNNYRYAAKQTTIGADYFTK